MAGFLCGAMTTRYLPLSAKAVKRDQSWDGSVRRCSAKDTIMISYGAGVSGSISCEMSAKDRGRQVKPVRARYAGAV